MFSDMENPEANPEMTRKTKAEQLTVKFKDSDVTPPFGYIALAHDLELSNPHSPITKSLTTSSSIVRKMSACMTKTPEENFSRQLEEHTWLQKGLRDIIPTQHEEINSLKLIISKFLEEEKNEKPRATNFSRWWRKKTKSPSQSSNNDKTDRILCLS